MAVAPPNPASLKCLGLPDGSEPAWDVVALFPTQGEWTEQDYFSLKTDRHVELVDGRIEVLPMPTEEHQSIVALLYELLVGFVRPRGLGKVLFSGLRVRIRTKHFREPDVVFMGKNNAGKRTSPYWRGADLAMEVVSPDDPDRDYVEKRTDYARAGVSEYWIVDPRNRTITLFALEGGKYAERGAFKDGQRVASELLAGFVVNVTDVFDAPAAE